MFRRLTSPDDLKQEFPTPPFSLHAQTQARQILRGKDKRLAILVGPCSIHDLKSTLEYARRLKKLSIELKDTLFLVMRVFIEKPRTQVGWKGILYDPYLDASNDIEAGLRMARELFIELAEMGVPAASELLDPLVSFYFDDLIAWGMIGARTSASQPHRQMASRLSFPVGFKNDFFGSLEPALFGVLSSRKAHSFLGLDPAGYISEVRSRGNLDTHIVLRGSENGPNFDKTSIETALRLLRENHLEPRLVVDCSHGNSGKNLERQKKAFLSVIDQISSDAKRSIIGVMLESHLFEGRQALSEDPAHLAYGVSITDPCLSWESTEELLRIADERLPLGPTSISLVQN